MLKIIGDLERLSDHAVNMIESAEEMRDKQIVFTDEAKTELHRMSQATLEILQLTLTAFSQGDVVAARSVEPLEQVIDALKERMRNRHIERLQQGVCNMVTGFVWSDILTNFERTSDHCSNVAASVIDAADSNLNIHESLRVMKTQDAHFKEQYELYAAQYLD